jgi:hypothetical protein
LTEKKKKINGANAKGKKNNGSYEKNIWIGPNKLMIVLWGAESKTILRNPNIYGLVQTNLDKSKTLLDLLKSTLDIF